MSLVTSRPSLPIYWSTFSIIVSWLVKWVRSYIINICSSIVRVYESIWTSEPEKKKFHSAKSSSNFLYSLEKMSSVTRKSCHSYWPLHCLSESVLRQVYYKAQRKCVLDWFRTHYLDRCASFLDFVLLTFTTWPQVKFKYLVICIYLCFLSHFSAVRLRLRFLVLDFIVKKNSFEE